MGLETLGGKPLDRIKDESGEKRGIYGAEEAYGIDGEEEYYSADDFVGTLDRLDDLGTEGVFSATDIGRFSIGTPTQDKQEAESAHGMEPLNQEVYKALEDSGELTEEDRAAAEEINREFKKRAYRMVAMLGELF